MASESMYKGKPILNLAETEDRPFSFGIVKARLILSNLGEIREFVAKHSGAGSYRGRGPIEDPRPSESEPKPGGKIPVKKITFIWKEGVQTEDFPVMIESGDIWRLAEYKLLAWSTTAPEKGRGYDKVKFVVEFADGNTYEGRHDLQRTGLDDSGDTLRQHVVGELKFYSGQRRPGWMEPEKYAAVIQESEKDGTFQQCAEMLNRYDI